MGHGRERTERERQLFCLLVAASALVEVPSTVCGVGECECVGEYVC